MPSPRPGTATELGLAVTLTALSREDELRRKTTALQRGAGTKATAHAMKPVQLLATACQGAGCTACQGAGCRAGPSVADGPGSESLLPWGCRWGWGRLQGLERVACSGTVPFTK